MSASRARPSARWCVSAVGRASPSLQLDRETEALLYWTSSATATPLWTLSPNEAREEYARTLSKTEIAPPGIGEASDLAVAGPAGPMRIRRYDPANAGGSSEAAILFVHGGGCVLGDVETHDILCRTLCHDTRATVLSLDYRLAPEHPFPAAVEDTVASLTRLSHEAQAPRACLWFRAARRPQALPPRCRRRRQGARDRG